MHTDLTPTEQIVLDMNARGCTQKQIAAEIGFGVRHVQRIVGQLRNRGHQVATQHRTHASKRPYQVAEMLTAGMTCREVATKLRLAPATVRDFQRKARRMGLAVPPPSEHGMYAQTLEMQRRDIRAIRAKPVKFQGNVFEDIKLKQR